MPVESGWDCAREPSMRSSRRGETWRASGRQQYGTGSETHPNPMFLKNLNLGREGRCRGKTCQVAKSGCPGAQDQSVALTMTPRALCYPYRPLPRHRYFHLPYPLHLLLSRPHLPRPDHPNSRGPPPACPLLPSAMMAYSGATAVEDAGAVVRSMMKVKWEAA